MAISSSFSGAKLETLLINYCSLSSASFPRACFPYQQPIKVFRKPNRGMKGVLSRNGAIRCEAAESNAFSEGEKIDLSKTAALSALEQLKTSAAGRYTKEKSSIVVIGLSVHTAPVEMREKLAIPEAEWPRAIGELCGLNHGCQRLVVSQFQRFASTGQILAQVKQVLKAGEGVLGFGRNIHMLFKCASTVGKRVRTETNIAAGAVSVSSAAVELALMKLPKSSHATARMLVIGAGKMGKLVIKHLVSKGCTEMVVINRSEEKVAAIREELEREAKGVEIIYRPLTDMLACSAEADVVFTSTSSEAPLFLKEHVKNLPPVSSEVGGLRLFIDISVPRNVGSCVTDIEGAQVYNVDDLKEVVAANKEDRLRKAMEAQSIIAEELNEFEAWRDSLETVPTLKKLRAYAERIRDAEFTKCLSKMGDDIPKKSKKAVEDLSRGIVNKLLHGPMRHLRCDNGDNRTLDEVLENMHALNRMFSLESDMSLFEQKIREKIEKGQK
ncbi:hypothetical protein V6N13_025992 [Hibiscus sabdariffa]|uniref:Uncharacterized protein n=2 Tax=Hibiscus sabdariffa TaxID=183260 RepID=A0ABR1ZDD0_9ROSI